MATGDGSGSDHLTHLARLTADPQHHHLYQALRIIEAAHTDAPRLGESRRPRQDAVRIEQEAELAFPPSTIQGFKTGAPARLTNRFFGLFGPHGPLPLHLTEHARDRLRNHRDPTFIAFANMLTHRMSSLLYRAWVSAQPAPSLDRPKDDTVERKVAAIAGYHGTHLRERDAFPDLGRRYFSAALAQGPKNAEGLTSILSAFFGASVTLQQFIGSWLELEPDDRWHLGNRTQLGHGTSIGGRVWSRSAKFRLRIGPLSLEDYKRILPGSPSLARFHAIVRSYVGDALDWDLNVVLRHDEVPQAVLGQTTQLGRTSWIGTRKSQMDADDLYLSAETLRYETASPKAA